MTLDALITSASVSMISTRTAVRNAAIGDVQGNAGDNFSVIDPDGLRVQISAPDWSA